MTLPQTRPKPGDPVPAFERAVTTADMMAYGAATWDWHRLHYDQDYARARGLPNVVFDGQAFGAFFARGAMDWLGPKAFIQRLNFKMRAMVFPGDTIRCAGEVTAVEAQDGATVVTLSQSLTVGERLAAEATTVVRLN